MWCHIHTIPNSFLLSQILYRTGVSLALRAIKLGMIFHWICVLTVHFFNACVDVMRYYSTYFMMWMYCYVEDVWELCFVSKKKVQTWLTSQNFLEWVKLWLIDCSVTKVVLGKMVSTDIVSKIEVQAEETVSSFTECFVFPQYLEAVGETRVIRNVNSLLLVTSWFVDEIDVEKKRIGAYTENQK